MQGVQVDRGDSEDRPELAGEVRLAAAAASDDDDPVHGR
jgi:hypothetical protein